MAHTLTNIAKRLLIGHGAHRDWNPAQLKRRLTTRILTKRPKARLIIILIAIFSAMCGLIAPYFQKIFLDRLLGHHIRLEFWLWSLEPTQQLVAAILCAFAGMILAQLSSTILRIFCAREAVILNGQLARELYTHALKLTGQSRSSKTIGEMVTVFTQDVSASVALVEDFIPSLLSSVLPVVIAPIAVSYYFGMPITQIFLVLGLSCALLMVLSYRQSFFFSAFKRLAGERLAIVNEWLQNIRIIRIMGWIELFEAKIQRKRIEETNNRILMVTNGSTMNSIAQVAPLIVNVIGVAILIKFNHDNVTPGDVFALLWIFGVFLARPLRNLPWTLVIFMDGYTSCGRLERFFRLSEEPLEPTTHKQTRTTRTGVGPRIEIKGLTLQMGNQVILRDINFTAEPGEFVAIIGEVGAGKTQFLLSMLRESPAVFDRYLIGDTDALKLSLNELRDHFTYVPQDGFTMSSSIRDNVAFRYDASAENDNDIIHSLELAEFNTRAEQLPDGLATEIGERGVNLSGGQRQRVGLARAHYHGRNLVILDDALSAVDVDTERKIIKNLLTGSWKNTTRILVTHRLSVLPFADRVYVMEHGRLRLQHGTA